MCAFHAYVFSTAVWDRKCIRPCYSTVRSHLTAIRLTTRHTHTGHLAHHTRRSSRSLHSQLIKVITPTLLSSQKSHTHAYEFSELGLTLTLVSSQNSHSQSCVHRTRTHSYPRTWVLRVHTQTKQFSKLTLTIFFLDSRPCTCLTHIWRWIWVIAPMSEECRGRLSLINI